MWGPSSAQQLDYFLRLLVLSPLCEELYLYYFIWSDGSPLGMWCYHLLYTDEKIEAQRM